MKKIDDMEGIYLGSFKLARAEMGVTAFGMAVMDIPAGYGDYPEHDHSEDGQEEVFYVLEGSGTMVVDGENVELKPDRYIWVEAESKRKILPGDEGLKLIAVGSPPGAYQPRQG